ncbi:hypothetical protein PF005_g15811 [Phytophthora fragariae]|uniref:Uncharacterized protein n=1 Tax=Phytophthora fragariae TaxID=53985 RepID=A0A6A3RG51_9STRA|nr:hypothetical protein PF003_g11017 [Phytophthora fragariae]KAE8932650.1 hypothetical protein PF009_g17322 [Phytophthora fragariae]KAE8999028.1 hypothetical protein PF011_g14796 [Phytophthora fragariae]KAE9075084.1 hypothetical protein PF010_g24447 [Phytophthora fragariae]KAE9096579.1 hypothetical protein PF007_g16946 [Phytophthora fragariae]
MAPPQPAAARARQEIDSAGIKRGSQSDSDDSKRWQESDSAGIQGRRQSDNDGSKRRQEGDSDGIQWRDIMSAAWIMIVLSNGPMAEGRERRQLQYVGSSATTVEGRQQSSRDGEAPAGTGFILDYGPAGGGSNRQQHQNGSNDRRVSDMA